MTSLRFGRKLETMRDPVTGETVLKLLEALGGNCRGSGVVYITGGSSAVVIGWRESTIDVDLKFQPEPPGVFDSIPTLKHQLNVNIELAAPDDFVPALPGWQERSPWIVTHNEVDFRHFDFYTQALSKLERDHTKDRADVAEMVRGGLVIPRRLLDLFSELSPEQFSRYPAIEPGSIESAIHQLIEHHDP